MNYDWTKPKETFETIKTIILDAVGKEEQWYRRARRWHSFLSRFIRSIAIILFAIGALYPILVPQIGQSASAKNYGYISLAVGGLILLLDKYLGVSTGYIRFYLAELEIKKNTSDFSLNWEMEISKVANPMENDSIVNLLMLLKNFQQVVYSIIQTETNTWATEFQAQTGELYELFKQKQNEYKILTGHLSVIVESTDNHKDIEIILDEKSTSKVKDGATSVLFKAVTIGPHQVQIRAKKGTNIVGYSKNIEVIADKTAEIKMTLT